MAALAHIAKLPTGKLWPIVHAEDPLGREALNSPSSIIEAPAAGTLLGRLKDQIHRADEQPRRRRDNVRPRAAWSYDHRARRHASGPRSRTRKAVPSARGSAGRPCRPARCCRRPDGRAARPRRQSWRSRCGPVDAEFAEPLGHEGCRLDLLERQLRAAVEVTAPTGQLVLPFGDAIQDGHGNLARPLRAGPRHRALVKKEPGLRGPGSATSSSLRARAENYILASE